MKILFICKHNRFRSKVAEALFNYYNKNKNIKAKSAGINPDILNVAENVHIALRERGVNKVDDFPRKVTKEMIEWADKVIVVADDVNPSIFGDKAIVWKIQDCFQDDLNKIRERVLLIEKEIKNFLKSN